MSPGTNTIRKLLKSLVQDLYCHKLLSVPSLSTLGLFSLECRIKFTFITDRLYLSPVTQLCPLCPPCDLPSEREIPHACCSWLIYNTAASSVYKLPTQELRTSPHDADAALLAPSTTLQTPYVMQYCSACVCI